MVMPECEMHKILQGQKALVTGVNSGIGKAVALTWSVAEILRALHEDILQDEKTP